MRNRLLLIGWMSLSALWMRAEVFPSLGVDSVRSAFFREQYVTTDLGHYLDNYNDYVVVESETTGEWNIGDRMIFSIAGNSFRQNRYWWNGMRVDSRAMTGSTLLHMNMSHTSLALNYHTGELIFEEDSVQRDMLRLTGNMGNLGGISPGTRELINLFHSSGEERTMDSRAVRMRNHVVSAGTAELTIGGQHLYVHYGKRKQTAFDQTGISGMIPADYMQVQIDGRIPLEPNTFADRLHYFAVAKTADDYLSEFLYNPDEQAHMAAVLAGLTSSKTFNNRSTLNLGLSLGVTDVRRDSVSFSRNLFDQDGEGFEPYYAPGKLMELNLSARYEWAILPWLRLQLSSYNSLIHQSTDASSFRTAIYAQSIADASPLPLYTYEWQAQNYTAGLLENELQVIASRQLTPNLYGEAAVGVTLDGLLQGSGRSLVSPNITAHAGLAWKPAPWFEIGLTLSHQRQVYTLNELQYLNATHLNADIRYADGTLLATTGGKYHTPSKDLWHQQPAYAVLDLPIRFSFGKNGRHEISLLNQARKYYNEWFTTFTDEGNLTKQGELYYLTEGEKQYTVTTQPLELMSGTWGGRTPYYLSNTIKYTYTSKHWFVALSWQSYLMAGISTLGNGVLHNNIGSLSESTANPNTFVVARSAGKPYQANCRLNQDKSFIGRIQVTYNPIKYFSASLNFKFKDGQPFSTFVTQSYTSPAVSSTPHTQVALYHSDAKGINMANGVFGKREDAFFNLDLRLTGRWWVGRGTSDLSETANPEKGKIPMELEILCYNLYDFGTALTEYTFDDVNHPTYPYWTVTRGIASMRDSRTSMSLCIPRGLLLTLRIGLQHD